MYIELLDLSLLDLIIRLALGLAIGFSVKLIFAGIQLAGQLAGYQMGLAIANVMDPSTSEQVPLLRQSPWDLSLYYLQHELSTPSRNPILSMTIWGSYQLKTTAAGSTH